MNSFTNYGLKSRDLVISGETLLMSLVSRLTTITKPSYYILETGTFDEINVPLTHENKTSNHAYTNSASAFIYPWYIYT